METDNKGEIFAKLYQLDECEQTYLLCRLFGIMETCESRNEKFDPKIFFHIVDGFKSTGWS